MPSNTIFLSKYYSKNFLGSKIGGTIVHRNIAKYAGNWQSLREKHAGKRDWLIVGNGPSLTVEDLEGLSHVPSIASNKIDLLFNKTTWRPSLYTASDNLVLFKLGREHYKKFPLLLVPDTGFYMARTHNKLPFKAVLGADREEWFRNCETGIDPTTTGFFDGNTVTTYNIQIALWLGAKNIYVLGCDHFYKESKHENVKKLSHEVATSNHFDPNYRKPGEIVNSAPIEKLEAGYSMVRQVAEKLGARIVNITRKTALPNFECGTVEDAIVRTQ